MSECCPFIIGQGADIWGDEMKKIILKVTCVECGHVNVYPLGAVARCEECYTAIPDIEVEVKE